MIRDLETGESRGNRFHQGMNTKKDYCLLGKNLALCLLLMAETNQAVKTGKAFTHSFIHSQVTASTFKRLGAWAERVVITTDMYRIKYYHSTMCKVPGNKRWDSTKLSGSGTVRDSLNDKVTCELSLEIE